MTYREPRSRHAEGYITWNGGREICQDDDTITVEIWVKDQRGYHFEVRKKIRKEELK
jgi:hypothetical protein